jgi:hypothetical protein
VRHRASPTARPRRLVAAAVLSACAWLATEARADGPREAGPGFGAARGPIETAPRILFVAPVATPFSARVRAEIEAMGFTVEPAETLDGEGPPTAVAAARVIEAPPPRRVELWIVDASRGRLTLRAVIRALDDGASGPRDPSEPSANDDEATQTVRASEELRAFFQPLREPPPRSPPPPEPPPETPLPALLATAPEPPIAGAPWPRFVASAAVAVPLEPGGPGADLALRFRWMATRRIGVGALVSIPVVGSTVSAVQGSASTSAAIFGAEVSAVLLDARPVRLAASAGLGAAWLRTTGFASAPYVGGSASLVTGLPFLGLEVAPRLTDHLRLYLGGHAGIALPSADIAFAGHTVATWGRPLGLLSAGMSLEL